MERANTGEQLLAFDVDEETGLVVIGNRPHEDALTRFRSNVRYLHCGDFVAAALGADDALTRLLPLAVEPAARRPLAALLTLRQYQAQNLQDQALAALAREDYDACVATGEVAVPVLARFLAHPLEEKSVVLVSNALRRLGGSTAADALAAKLDWYAKRSMLHYTEAVVALLSALGSVGSAAHAARLRAFCGDHNKRIAGAAQEALAALTQRHRGESR